MNAYYMDILDQMMYDTTSSGYRYRCFSSPECGKQLKTQRLPVWEFRVLRPGYRSTSFGKLMLNFTVHNMVYGKIDQMTWIDTVP